MDMDTQKRFIRKQRLWMRIGVACSMAMVLGGLLFFSATIYQTTRYATDQQETTGRVVNFYSTRHAQEYAIVEFKTSDGETHTARTETTAKDVYKYSQTLPVRYGSNDPSNAMAGDIESTHYMSTGYIVGPILILLGGFLTFSQVAGVKMLNKAWKNGQR